MPPAPVPVPVSSSSSTRVSHIKPPRWSDEDTPSEYFNKFEKAMTHNKTDKSEWGTMLPVYLSGRSQASLAEVEDDDLDDYDKIKEKILVSLGDTTASADRKWWKLSRLPSEDPGALCAQLDGDEWMVSRAGKKCWRR